ncbi:hypothetical protein SprV_0200575400 [Sparganum proliferum]
MEEFLLRHQGCLPKELLLSSAPTEVPYSLRRHKSYKDGPSTSEASSVVLPPSPTSPSSVCLKLRPNPNSPSCLLYMKPTKPCSSSSTGMHLDRAQSLLRSTSTAAPQLMDHLTALFREMWRQGNVPQDFKDVALVHLYERKGDRQICDNNRGISLLNIAGKIFAHILFNRLSNYLEQVVLPESHNDRPRTSVRR